MAEMLNRANLVLTAWDGERMVGIARTLTDFCYVAYLADLAVDWPISGRASAALWSTRHKPPSGPAP